MTIQNDHSAGLNECTKPAAALPAGDAPPALTARPAVATPPEPYLPRWVRTAEHQNGGFDVRRLGATWHYLTHPWHRMPRALLWWMWQGVRGMKGEFACTARGVGKLADGIYSFSAALDHEKVVQLSTGTTHAPRASERHVNAKTARRRIILAAAGALSILGVWLGIYHPYAGLCTLAGIVIFLDFLGHLGRPRSEAPPRRIQPLVEGRPLNQVRIDVETILIEEGYAELITVAAVRHDLYQHAFIVEIRTHTEIKVDLLRQLERRLYAPPFSIYRKFDPDDASCQSLVVKLASPLANVPEAPWIPAGDISGWQPLDLGYSANPDCPFVLVLVMRHILLVAQTRGGKTVHLSNIIDRLSGSRDTVICGAALVKSAVFDSWRSVIYKKAENVDEVRVLLQWLIDEIHRRDKILKDINSDDDPNNDVDKWDSSLGHAIVCILDEFMHITKYDGTKLDANGDKPNLLAMVESIICTGAGLGVSLILAVQASGNDNWGSSTILKQTTVKIIGPVDERDTVDILGKDKRDQGYAPHLLQPADEHSANDAGMAVIDAPGFGPEYVRGYTPFKVKARAIRREKEWAEHGNRPVLPLSTEPELAIVMEATTVPTALVIIDRALNHYRANILSSVLVIDYASQHFGEEWTINTLPEALRNEVPGNEEGLIITPHNGRCKIKGRVVKSYHREDVTKAMSALEARL